MVARHSRLLRLTLVFVLASAVVLIWSSGALASVWSGSGTPPSQVDRNGAGGIAQFSYNVNQGCCASGNWIFSTVADTNGAVPLTWTYNGYHAFFEVTVSLNVFVTHLGVTTTTPLVNDGPVDCCTPPSGGFAYSGKTTVHVSAGDTYGFTFSGSNFDSDGRLIGTLRILLPVAAPWVPPPPRAAYCSAAGNTNPFTGAPIAPGTFLDLLYSQPDTDPNYKGATFAIFVEGKGLTCDPPPPGYVPIGYAGDDQHVAGGIYAYYAPPPG